LAGRPQGGTFEIVKEEFGLFGVELRRGRMVAPSLERAMANLDAVQGRRPQK
jgi:hypothetical protein